YYLIFKTSPGTNMAAIVDAYDGKVLDALGDNTYLLKTKRQTPRSLVPGVLSVESNKTVASSKGNGAVVSGKGAVVSTGAGTVADWYAQQPALQLIHANRAGQIATGKGIVIADVNSITDYSHPALRGHLTGGYDFVANR